MKVGGNINIFGIDLRWYLGTFKKFNTYKMGITNRCKDGQFVLFLDYDNVPLPWIQEELRNLQKTYNVGDIHIFKTSKGFHVINTEKRSFTDILFLMKKTSCDPLYIDIPLRYGKKAWTLRLSDKKGKDKTKFVQTLKNEIRRETSKPHNWLIKELYGVNVNTEKEDGEKHFYKSSYPLAE